MIKIFNNDWDVSFEGNRGALPRTHFDKLISFTEHPVIKALNIFGKSNLP